MWSMFPSHENWVGCWLINLYNCTQQKHIRAVRVEWMYQWNRKTKKPPTKPTKTIEIWWPIPPRPRQHWSTRPKTRSQLNVRPIIHNVSWNPRRTTPLYWPKHHIEPHERHRRCLGKIQCLCKKRKKGGREKIVFFKFFFFKVCGYQLSLARTELPSIPVYSLNLVVINALTFSIDSSYVIKESCLLNNGISLNLSLTSFAIKSSTI